MKFEFSFTATPTISCCFPSRPIIEKSPSQFMSTIDTTDIDWEVRDVLFDELDIEPQDLKVTETNITADISGEKLEFSGHLTFERLDGKTTEIVDLTEAFRKRMMVEFSDNDVLDALDDLLDEDCEDGYYLEVVIQENDVKASTKLTD